MSARFPCLALVLAFLAVLRLLGGNFAPVQEPLSGRTELASAERAFAWGSPISLWDADQWDLELVPGISDRLARRLLAERTSLRAQADALPSAEAWKALTSVRGIGAASAERLRRYLDLRARAKRPASSPETLREGLEPPLHNIFEE